MPGPDRRRRQRARSALYYGNGESGELETGARLLAPSLGLGVAASYARHEADGVGPLHHSRSTRYALASGLPGALGHQLWIEGHLFKWSLEDKGTAIAPESSLPKTAIGRAEIEDQGLRLHGLSRGERGTSSWIAAYQESKRTRVEPRLPEDPPPARERWVFPEVALQWDGRLDLTASTAGHASIRAASRRIEYRVDRDPLFRPRREEARIAIGLGRSVGPDAGVRADAAWDWRETDGSLVDGRLSIWTAGRRISGRIDAEHAHERPTWIDRLAPERVIRDTLQNIKPLHLLRSGDPSLGARRLTGALARGSYELSRAIGIDVEGSMRRVEDDFGWDHERVDTADTLFVSSRAARRGDGWVSYGGVGIRARVGAFTLRGAGWARGGPERLSPRGGSPPRLGAEGAAAFGVVLFGGDLPLEAGVQAHIEGPRSGTIREPGWATFDGAIRADFGPAGAFAEMMNVFDRVVPSAIEDIATGRATPMPGRSFHIGLVWYLLD